MTLIIFISVVTYGSETWALIKKEQEKLRSVQRKIIRTVYGPVKEGDECRIKNNQEIGMLLKHEDFVRFTQAQRIKWIGHLEWMDDQRRCV